MLGGTGYFICLVRFVNQNWLTSRKVMPTLFKCERHKNNHITTGTNKLLF